jgi:hypothetical protein
MWSTALEIPSAVRGNGLNGTWQLWQDDITETEIQFKVIPGHNLYFRVRWKSRAHFRGIGNPERSTEGLEGPRGPCSLRSLGLRQRGPVD